MLGKLDETVVQEKPSNDVFEGAVEQEKVSSNTDQLGEAYTDYNVEALFWAASSGRFDIISACLKHGCDVNAKDSASGSETALHKCVRHRHTEVCRVLLEAGCHVNALNSPGETSMLRTCRSESCDALQGRTHDGADINASCSDGVTHPMRTMSHSQLPVKDCSPSKVNMSGARASSSPQSWHDDSRSTVGVCPGQCDVDARDSTEKTALHAAAETDSADIVRLLLEHGARPTAVDSMGRTPLALAAQLGHWNALHALIRCRVAINTTNTTGMTPLHWAVAGRHVECVRDILKDADVNTSVANVGTGNTALITAVEDECVEIVRMLILANCNVNAINWGERSALHEAADRGHVEICELLLCGGAYIDMQTSDGDSALIMAARSGYTGVVRLLIGNNCNTRISNVDHVTALHTSAMNGRVRITGMLLSAADTPVDLVDMDGDTPLILAAARGHFRVVAMLLAHRECDPNRVNYMGRSAQLEACRHSHCAVVSLLLRKGARINVYDSEGDSALILAAPRGYSQVVDVLLRARCDASHVNVWGQNALHEACSAWSRPSSTVELLASSGLNVNDVDGMGNTPLILATLGCRSDIVRALLSADCDVNKAGTTNMRPLEIAVAKESVEIMQMLYAAGCDMNGIDVSTAVSRHVTEWLRSVASRPHPLKQICRVAVRTALRSPADHKVKCLPLPQQMKQYLLFEDIDHLIVLPASPV